MKLGQTKVRGKELNERQFTNAIDQQLDRSCKKGIDASRSSISYKHIILTRQTQMEKERVKESKMNSEMGNCLGTI